ncbi:hypothetical protein EMPG_11649 [Blastomyces silverae]|uniref:SMP domain-containing protein n=1 Tax=Blastomyces silverae TaxID=2060906 RepID=A0A0H1BQM1_9EURO|nr:hypothetical protein EMPG_11649 [Blastomyces silverae]
MSGTKPTFHTTKEDIRKAESQISGRHGGNVSKDSDVSAMKSVIDSQTDKSADIDRRKANLPLPEQPPAASDLKSANMKTTGTGSGAVSGISPNESESGLRGPATAESSVRTSGDELKTNTAPK